MASTVSKILDTILRTLHVKNSFEKIFSRRDFGKGDLKEPPKNLYNSVTIDRIEEKNGTTFILKPKDKQNEVNKVEMSSKQILYLHGGGYIHGFNLLHWQFLKTLAVDLNCTIIAPEYPLAPEFTFHDSFEMVIPLYKKLIDEAGSDNLILMGDSSGGGFALALAQKMDQEKYSMAQQLILISPWLDITLKNKDIAPLDSQDPILGIKGLRKAGKAYAGESDPENYLLSPINGNCEGLGKISIFIGTKDILVADTRKFKKMMDEKGIKINYFEYDDMLHVWPLFNLPESKLALKQIKYLIDPENFKEI